MTPIIGISAGVLEVDNMPRVALGDVYVRSILRAGGIPVILPALIPPERSAELLERLDGVLVSGGPDMETALFNGEEHPRVYGVDPRRDSIEMALVRTAVEQRVPLLGICRGVQVMNVALGGTLYTHISDQLPGAIEHDTFHTLGIKKVAHPVRVQPGSRLAEITGAGELMVNSFHHQGICGLAEALRPVAWSADGLVESVELAGKHPFALGVQWHPEWMPDDARMQALFRAFVQAAD